MLNQAFSEANISSVTLKKEADKYSISQRIGILKDKDSSYTIQDIYQQKFVKTIKRVFNKGYGNEIYWVKFSITNALPADQTLYLNTGVSSIDRIDFYIIENQTNVIEHQTLGDAYPFHHREVKFKDLVFKFQQEKYSTRDYVARIQTQTGDNYALPWVLFKENGFLDYVSFIQIFFGLFFGTMLMLFIYNLVLFLISHDIKYLSYILYLMMFMLFQAIEEGYAFQYLWPNMSVLADYAFHLFAPFIALSAIFFTKQCLNLPKTSWMNRVLNYYGYAALWIFSLSAYAVIRKFNLIYFVPLLVPYIFSLIIFLIFFGIKKSLQKSNTAKLYTLGWLIFFVGSVVYLLKGSEVLPSNLFTEKFRYVSTLLELFVFSMIFSDKVKELEESNEVLKHENEQMLFELGVAQKIQKMITPQQDEIDSYTQNLQISMRMLTAEQVGGDYYDIIPMSDDKLLISIGDVAGHGLSAGLLMLMAQTALITLVAKEKNITQLLMELNQVLYKNIQRTKTDKTMTLSLLSYHESSYVLTGKHEHVLILRNNNQIETIDTSKLGFFIGMFPDISHTVSEYHFKLEKGEQILLYTDGIIEAVNQSNEAFSIEGLKKIFLDCALNPNIKTTDEAIDLILTKLFEYQGHEKLEDDVALVLIKQQ